MVLQALEHHLFLAFPNLQKDLHHPFPRAPLQRGCEVVARGDLLERRVVLAFSPRRSWVVYLQAEFRSSAVEVALILEPFETQSLYQILRFLCRARKKHQHRNPQGSREYARHLYHRQSQSTP